mmetsp:Transcript_44296/g.79461  ORF Transcript_44296/g.79461 Transcript_44296/m.79461 type:complete len:201 (+) Transcript_44296:1149-1751(+)
MGHPRCPSNALPSPRHVRMARQLRQRMRLRMARLVQWPKPSSLPRPRTGALRPPQTRPPSPHQIHRILTTTKLHGRLWHRTGSPLLRLAAKGAPLQPPQRPGHSAKRGGSRRRPTPCTRPRRTPNSSWSRWYCRNLSTRSTLGACRRFRANWPDKTDRKSLKTGSGASTHQNTSGVPQLMISDAAAAQPLGPGLGLPTLT